MRILLRAASTALVAAGIAGAVAPAGASAATPCPKADQPAASLTARQMRAATICLLNIERRRHGLAPLHQQARLAAAGTGHARDMVRTKYFSHVSRSGAKFDARIKRTGYAANSRGAIVGENLAWGTGDLSSPASIVRAWMNSRLHRANILQPRFRDIGIAIVTGTPGHGGGATYATEFGARF